MSPETARPARELQMLDALVDCAHALALAFGGAARAEADPRRCLDLSDAFQKSFLAVRMGIRLAMSLRASKPATALLRDRPEVPERERAEADAPERDPSEDERAEVAGPERDPERDRERDCEPVSLPRFLATLGLVARDAARLDDRVPAAAQVLPRLQGLLATVATKAPAATPAVRKASGRPEPATAMAVPAIGGPSAPGGTRHRLLASAAAAARPSGRPSRGPPRASSG